VDLLGRGGMASSSRPAIRSSNARSPSRSSALSWPRVPPHASASSAKGRQRQAVKHEHVVTVYGVEGHEESPYWSWKYVEGTSLEDRLSKFAPLPTEEVVKLGVQIAEVWPLLIRRVWFTATSKRPTFSWEKETDRVSDWRFRPCSCRR